MKRTLFFAVAVVLLALFSSTAILLAEEQSGRYGLREGAFTEGSPGTLGTMKGTLGEENGEWILEAGKKTYLLHFGNRAYLAGTGMPLKDGKEITVEGSVLDDDIIVFNATLDGKTYGFRDKSGVPLWAQDGERFRRRPGDGEYGRGRRGGRGCWGGGDWAWRDRDDDCYGGWGRGRR
jgi:hypothetical protein